MSDDALSENGLYWANDVARLLFGRTIYWFYAHRGALEEEGFPRPISKIGRPRWSGHALIAWRDRTPSAIETYAPCVNETPRSDGPDYTNILILRAAQMTKSKPRKSK